MLNPYDIHVKKTTVVSGTSLYILANSPEEAVAKAKEALKMTGKDDTEAHHQVPVITWDSSTEDYSFSAKPTN